MRRERAGATIPASVHVVLLAGGSGTRFWPLSRARRPKQFLRLLGPKSLLRSTWDRARVLAPPSRIWLVAPAPLAAAIRGEIPGLREDRLVIEPAPRDTAPAITLACAAVAAREPGATVVVLPTDHAVADVASFARAVRAACREAAKGRLVCLGIPPRHPATGFGYVETRKRPRAGTAAPVHAFVEKPSLARARRYVQSGRYLWNAGIFVWRASRFLDEVTRAAPGICAAARAAVRGDARPWRRLRGVSVDYAVMEKAADVSVVPLDAGWDDVGSWEAAARLAPSSSPLRPDHVAIASERSVVFGRERLVVLVGVPDVVIVDTPDALLVAARDAGERMREAVAAVKAAGRGDLA